MKSTILSMALVCAGLLASGAALSQSGQRVEFQNVTRNGSVVQGPLFVVAGDSIKFDAALTQNVGVSATGTGLGLCLEYQRAVAGDPVIRNIFLPVALFADGEATPLQSILGKCQSRGASVVPGADYAVIKGWASVNGNFPGQSVPFPVKLYDAQFIVATTPPGLTYVGFGATSGASGQTFSSNGPLALCGKPTVTVSTNSNGSEVGAVPAMINIALSAPVPAECGTQGVFQVTLTLGGTAAAPGQPNADYSISGAQISASGNTIIASFPANGSTSALTFSAKPIADGISEGSETVTLTVAAGSGNYVGVGGTASASILETAIAVPIVVEYLDTIDFPTSPGGHFFYSSDPAEQAAVDAGAAGSFRRTGRTFKTGGSSPVCRFYGSIAPGPNSHFFTVNPDECNQLKTLQRTPTPLDAQQWNYERIEYSTTPPIVVNGVLGCPAGTSPVYRAYNNAFSTAGVKNPWDSNHRFTPVLADIAAMVAQGWRDEGIQFCTAQ